MEGGIYRLDDPGELIDNHETTRTVAIEQTYGPLRSIGAPLLSILALAGLVGLGIARSRNRIELTAAERERLAYEDDREDFDEWISTMELPSEAFERPRAEATSLAALVDFAIDTDNGVVEDPTREAYYVLHDGYLYTYQPESPDDERSRVGESDGNGTELPDGQAASERSDVDGSARTDGHKTADEPAGESSSVE